MMRLRFLSRLRKSIQVLPSSSPAEKTLRQLRVEAPAAQSHLKQSKHLRARSPAFPVSSALRLPAAGSIYGSPAARYAAAGGPRGPRSTASASAVFAATQSGHV